MVKGAFFIETPHVHGPFDRRAGARDRELSRSFTGDGHDAAIDFRRMGRVDGKLGLAGLFAFGKRRIVEERKTYGAFDFSARSPARNTDAAWVSMRCTFCPPWLAGSPRKPNTSSWPSAALSFMKSKLGTMCY